VYRTVRIDRRRSWLPSSNQGDCANGNPEALGELFDRHHLTVYRLVGRLCWSDCRDVDDLVQATFVEVQRAARGFRGGSAVKTWILGIAANVARHHVRSESRQRALLGELGEHVVAKPCPRADIVLLALGFSMILTLNIQIDRPFEGPTAK
jgi:RNA polymerase sigma factor (sigma-70 family)